MPACASDVNTLLVGNEQSQLSWHSPTPNYRTDDCDPRVSALFAFRRGCEQRTDAIVGMECKLGQSTPLILANNINNKQGNLLNR